MTEPTPDGGRTAGPAPKKLAAAALAAAAVVVALALALGGGDDTDAVVAIPSSGSSVTVSPSPAQADPAPAPSAAESSSPTAEPEATEATTPTAQPALDAPPAQPALDAPPAPPAPPAAEGQVPQIFGDQPAVVPAPDTPAAVTPGVEARVVSVERVRAEGTGVGQVAGDAALVTLEVQNTTGEPVSLATAAVRAYTADGFDPATAVDSDERARPFSGTVAPGQRVEGRYLFTLPADGRALSVALLVDLDSPVIVFERVVPAAG